MATVRRSPAGLRARRGRGRSIRRTSRHRRPRQPSRTFDQHERCSGERSRPRSANGFPVGERRAIRGRRVDSRPAASASPSTPRPGEATRTAQGAARVARVARSRPATAAGAGVAGATASAASQEPQGGGQEVPWQGELVPVKGLLDLRDEGYGFLRTSGYLPSPRTSTSRSRQARRFALRRGDAIEGACRPAGPSEKYPALVRIDTVCGHDARRGAAAAALRGPDAAVPRRAAPARAAGRPAQHRPHGSST